MLDDDGWLMSRLGRFISRTRHVLDGAGIEAQWRKDFPHLLRPDPGPTQRPIK